MSKLLPSPQNPQYPDKTLVNEPVVQGIPLVDPESGFWQQLKSWMPFQLKHYLIKEDYFTWSPKLQAWIWIPENFVYNGASVPQIPFGIFLRPNGILFYGSLPHDFGRRFDGLFLATEDGGPYIFTPMNKSKIDCVFDDLNEKASKLRLFTGPAYWAIGLLDTGPGGMVVEDQDWTQPVWRT